VIAALVGSGTAIILAILAASWALAGRIARVETKVEAIAGDVQELKNRRRGRD
jgi:outer membrane murein-binding lipoprotein Lpp